ncbi:hypothetical protein MKEN_00999500 [Mycena kentingensis (nom. inval.)]|nr:hypothetical protein MKEN_00999500 [Mycena kentingensis (nom. inval.)]
METHHPNCSPCRIKSPRHTARLQTSLGRPPALSSSVYDPLALFAFSFRPTPLTPTLHALAHALPLDTFTSNARSPLALLQRNMSSIAAAISHAVAFLLRPLLANAATASTCSTPGKAFSTSSITSAHLILTTSFAADAANTRGMSTYVLTPTAVPIAIQAAVTGSGLVWKDWFAALVRCAGDAKAERVLLFFGPGYAKVRIGDGRVVDLFARNTIPAIRIPASPKQKAAPTSAQLRAALLSAQLRLKVRPTTRRAPGVVRAPSPLCNCSASASEDEDDSDSESDASFEFSDSESDSDATTAVSSPSSSPAMSPVKPAFSLPAPAPAASAAKYVHPRARARAAAPVVPTKAPVFLVAPRPRVSSLPKAQPTAAKTTAYMYSGGVTKVMTGGVMLGPKVVAPRF